MSRDPETEHTICTRLATTITGVEPDENPDPRQQGVESVDDYATRVAKTEQSVAVRDGLLALFDLAVRRAR